MSQDRAESHQGYSIARSGGALMVVVPHPTLPCTPASSPDCVDQETAILLEDTRHFIRRFLAISDAQSVALCLFTLYTYAAEQFECAPYLQVTSAEKRSGKSRVLEVLELLVNRPWLTCRTSAAALVRNDVAVGRKRCRLRLALVVRGLKKTLFASRRRTEGVRQSGVRIGRGGVGVVDQRESGQGGCDCLIV